MLGKGVRANATHMNENRIEELVELALASAKEQRRPESTYRLQFHTGFQFRDAIAILPYLRELGITHVYASPYLKATKGSTHGYDIVDHRSINPEIGDDEAHAAFLAALKEHDLRLILDIVPNHMGVATNDNLWWNDVLENGPASPYAGYFDIAWDDTPRPELKQKVLLPVLGDPYGTVLESGQLKLAYEGGQFVVWYFERRFPVAPRSYAIILKHRIDELKRQLRADSLDFAEYQSILVAIGHLPDRTETDLSQVVERHREKEIIKRRLREITGKNGEIHKFIESNVQAINGAKGDPRSFDLLDDLLSHQCYRMSFWRVALEEINYRRFFDVNDLAALCTEREEVFDAVHGLIFKLLENGEVDGLRVDHPDGLYDPQQYFHRLQAKYLLARARAAFDSAQRQELNWTDVAMAVSERIEAVLTGKKQPGERWPLYLIAEKILGVNEPLPSDWAIDGTCGYEFVRAVNSLFVDGTAEAEFTRMYRELNANYSAFNHVLYRSKRLILSASLAAELNMLAYQLDRLAQKSRRSRDFTLNGLRDALREVISCFPVYRSYISSDEITHRDREMVETAVNRAEFRNPLISPAVLRFVSDMLLLKYPEGATEEDRAEQRRFTGKFQQLTSPVMAKGLEDTAFYLYNRLTSLNEVGGTPEWPQRGPETLHKFNAEKQSQWPYSLSPLSTHDTKRSEDVRARINVLSEIPAEWSDAVRRWFGSNVSHRKEIDGCAVPDANEEYLIYQTLIGVWPPGVDEPDAVFIERIKAYMKKALHEAKIHSSWLNPNAVYDSAVQEFVGLILDSTSERAFLEDFLPLQKRVARYGAINSLAQTLLKFTVPGVADTYQGTEIPDFSLVDPDNRRPVDYAKRQGMLKELQEEATTGETNQAFASDLSHSVEDGRAKLYVTWLALQMRRQFPGLFSEGEYYPLVGEGSKADHVFAFARRYRGTTAIIVVPRLLARLNSASEYTQPSTALWGDTRLEFPLLKNDSTWGNAFTKSRITTKNRRFYAADLLAHFPVALLLAEKA